MKKRRIFFMITLVIGIIHFTGCQTKDKEVISSNANNVSDISIYNENKEPTTPIIEQQLIQAEPSIYRFGSTGKEVEQIQENLIKFGYSLTVDGNYGYGTKDAVTDFQTRNGLDVDGEVGSTSMAKLKEDITDKSRYSIIDYSLFHTDNQNFMNSNSLYSDTPYFITVSLNKKVVNIYQGDNKNWKLAKTFICDVGQPSTPTVSGRFRVGIKGQSFGQNEGFMCKYYTQFHGNYLFHSIVYSLDGSVMDGRLGMSISHGCVRLSEENAKWIFDTIPKNTQVLLR